MRVQMAFSVLCSRWLTTRRMGEDASRLPFSTVVVSTLGWISGFHYPCDAYNGAGYHSVVYTLLNCHRPSRLIRRAAATVLKRLQRCFPAPNHIGGLMPSFST